MVRGTAVVECPNLASSGLASAGLVRPSRIVLAGVAAAVVGGILARVVVFVVVLN